MDWQALILTLQLALSTSAILLLAGLPIAWWLATTRRRWRSVVEAAVMVPLILPPTVLGFYLLVGLGPNSWTGQLLETLFGRSLPFSFAGILVGSIIYNLPFAVGPFTAAIAAVDQRLVEASWCLGASPVRTFFRVVLPLSRRGIMAGLLLTFAHAMGEFGVVLMLGGNIPGVTRTLSIAIYDDVQAMNYTSASRASMALLCFSLVVLTGIYSSRRRVSPL